MAIGLALLFNIKLPINFNSPYKATDIQDFWRRWHITLSRFLKDYVYIPLGGNRKGEFRTYNNLLATFIIGGIWHGAGWTFVFWGFLHGMALVIHRAWSKLGFKLWTWLAWIITFNFINIAWVFFRAKEWDAAVKVIDGMFNFNNIVLSEKLAIKLSILLQYGVSFDNISVIVNVGKALPWIVISFVIVLYFKNSIEIQNKFKANLFYFIGILLLTITALGKLNEFSEFLYFNF